MDDLMHVKKIKFILLECVCIVRDQLDTENIN